MTDAVADLATSAAQKPGTTRTLLAEKDAGGSVVTTVRRTVLPGGLRVITEKIPVDKIGEIIGPKGKIINQIQDDTGADLTVEDDGTIYIAAVDGEKAEAALRAVRSIVSPQLPEVGERYMGTVVKTTTFGAFVSLVPGKDGLLHISQIRKMVGGKRVENVEDVLAVGQKVQVQISEIDPRGKLSLVPVLPEGEGGADGQGGDGQTADGPTSGNGQAAEQQATANA